MSLSLSNQNKNTNNANDKYMLSINMFSIKIIIDIFRNNLYFLFIYFFLIRNSFSFVQSESYDCRASMPNVFLEKLMSKDPFNF